MLLRKSCTIYLWKIKVRITRGTAAIAEVAMTCPTVFLHVILGT